MNIFCMVLLALCPLSTDRKYVFAVNILTRTAFQDSLEEEENQSVCSIILKMNEHLLNRTVDKQLILFGDIAVDASKNLRICDQCLWPKSNDGKIYVPYIFDGVFNTADRAKISTALLELSMFTCLKFVYRTNQVAHMKFISASGCWSVVGRTGSKQQVSLERPSCVHHAVIQHEVMHVLGFEHEHSRSDRDNYIRIMKENIKDGRLENFVKMRTNNMKTPYDYLSVMHYGKTYFSKNDQPTMVAISDPSLKLGQTIGITEIDVLKLNRFYNCKPLCSKLMLGSTATFTTPNYPDLYPNKADCKWSIKLPRRKKILLQFASYQIQPFLNCYGDQVTVYDGSDFHAPILFGPDCGAEKPLLISKQNKMFIMFRSTRKSRATGFSATYKTLSFCAAMMTNTKDEIRYGRFLTLPYDDHCTWVVLSPRAHLVVWKLTHFFIKESENCADGYLRVTDTSGPTPIVKGTLCGKIEVPLNITSSGRTLLFNYFQKAPGISIGFRSSFTFIKNPNPPRVTNKPASEGNYHNASGLLLCILLIYSQA